MRMLKKSAFIVAATCAALAAGQASALESQRAPVQVRLSTTGVDFQDKAAVKRFYRRLETAAWRACDSQVPDLSLYSQDVRCAQAATRQAVATLDRPLVTALHSTKTSGVYARGY